jgi:hypothetical protein
MQRHNQQMAETCDPAPNLGFDDKSSCKLALHAHALLSYTMHTLVKSRGNVLVSSAFRAIRVVVVARCIVTLLASGAAGMKA